MNSVKILIGDDHRIVREGLKQVLADAPEIEVVAEASDGKQAVEQIPLVKPDVVLMDMRMPIMSGLDALQALSKINALPPTIILTTFDDDQLVLAGIKYGAKGYLLKDVSLDQLVTVFASVASALKHMHRRGVFHADLKPNNILYGKRGEVRVIDYGLAWVKGEPKDRVQGTPEYMAPETAKSRVINERTDIYNLGATMYRITTLKLPPCAVGGADSIRVTAKTHAAMLTPVGELNKAVPKALGVLIHRCLDYNPERRPERVGEVLDELRRIADEAGTPLDATGEH